MCSSASIQEILVARRVSEAVAATQPDPYLREVEGDVYGQEYWDTTPGLDVMRQVVDGSFDAPCFRLFGIRGVEANEGEMTMSMPASPWLCNSFGVLYGGAIAFLADATMILGAGTTVPAGTAFNSIDLKLYFLRPALPADGELSRAPRSCTGAGRSRSSTARSRVPMAP